MNVSDEAILSMAVQLAAGEIASTGNTSAEEVTDSINKYMTIVGSIAAIEEAKDALWRKQLNEARSNKSVRLSEEQKSSHGQPSPE